MVGDVVALHENAGQLAVGAEHRLIDEIDEALLRIRAAVIQHDRRRAADIRFAASIDGIEQLDEALIGDFGKCQGESRRKYLFRSSRS